MRPAEPQCASANDSATGMGPVEWVGLDGAVEDSAYYTLEDLEREGITFGRAWCPRRGRERGVAAVIEYSPDRGFYAGKPTFPKVFAQVTFTLTPQGLRQPQWQWLPKGQVEALIGWAL